MGEAARITSYGGYVEMNYYQYSSLPLKVGTVLVVIAW
jgi:hypothetical protein